MRILIVIALIVLAGGAKAQTLDPFYRYSITDTITNTESDTILLPALMLSPWSYNWTIQTAQLSGTTNLAYTVQESSSVAGSDWLQVGTGTATGATFLGRLVGALIYGQRQRIIITGTGTQSTLYTVYFVGKK
jgi:hypothetical protein